MKVKRIIESFTDKGYTIKIINKGLKGLNVRVLDTMDNKTIQSEIVYTIEELTQWLKTTSLILN